MDLGHYDIVHCHGVNLLVEAGAVLAVLDESLAGIFCHCPFHAKLKHIVDCRHKVVLDGIQLLGEHRHVRTGVFGFSKTVLDVVEVVAPCVEAKLDHERGTNHGKMIVEALVQVLDTACGKHVAVYVKHKREYLQRIAAHHSGHGHVVYHGLGVVLEQQQLCYLGELLAVLQGKLAASKAHDSVHGGQFHVHHGVNFRSRSNFHVQVSGEGVHDGHLILYIRKQCEHFFCGNIDNIQVKSCLYVFLGAGGVEAFHVEVSHVGGGKGVGYLQGAVTHCDIGRSPADQKAVVLYAVGFQHKVGFKVGRQYDEVGPGYALRR